VTASRSEWHGDTEVGVFAHEGREFRAGGSYIAPGLSAVVYGYVSQSTVGERPFYLSTWWDGQFMFVVLHRTATWKVTSYLSRTMSSWTATINGKKYNGRSAGVGSFIRLTLARGKQSS
jgi:hypothetical protein